MLPLRSLGEGRKIGIGVSKGVSVPECLVFCAVKSSHICHLGGPELGGGDWQRWEGEQRSLGLRREERGALAQVRSREEAVQREGGGGCKGGQGGAWRPWSGVPWVVMGSHVKAAKPGHEGVR